jgi:hypothetical protein
VNLTELIDSEVDDAEFRRRVVAAAEAEETGPREYATRVTSTVDDRPPLILPAPGALPAKAHAAAVAQSNSINADGGAARAEVVWRPAGGWRPVSGPSDPWPGGE